MKKIPLSVILITKDADALLDRVLKSIDNIAGEIIVVDSYSSDRTIKIAQKYKAIILQTKEEDLGKKRQLALKHTKNKWVLALDADEIVPKKLNDEIKNIILDTNNKIEGFIIPYKNHYIGKPIKHGGENYKILRLFNKDKVNVSPALLHEKFEVRGETRVLTNHILHFSYQSIFQTYIKFTKYAIRGAQQKVNSGEKLSVKKLTLYPLHMFWARYYEDKGYKDGLFRLPLDIGFSYMEFMTYFLMIFLKKKQ